MPRSIVVQITTHEGTTRSAVSVAVQAWSPERQAARPDGEIPGFIRRSDRTGSR